MSILSVARTSNTSVPEEKWISEDSSLIPGMDFSDLKIHEEKLHLKISIHTEQSMDAFNRDSGVHFCAYPYSLTAQIGTSNSLQIQVKEGASVREIELPKPLGARLLHLLVQGRPHPKFCCVDFVTYLFDCFDSKKLGCFQAKSYRVVDEKEPIEAGKVLCIMGSNQWPAHFALSVGSSLFLSVFGNGGYLIITNLKEIMAGYRGAELRVVELK